MIHAALSALIAAFPVSEIALALLRRSRPGSAQSEDRGSLRRLWLCVVVGVAFAMAAQFVPAARLRLPATLVDVVALALMAGGLAVRWAAILTLGRLFTVDVAIHAGHVVVERGLYRFVRHPSYTGLLLAFLGFGVAFANWLSLVGLLVPVTWGVLDRVAKEERALRALGPAYEAYRARTKRFLPGLW